MYYLNISYRWKDVTSTEYNKNKNVNNKSLSGLFSITVGQRRQLKYKLLQVIHREQSYFSQINNRYVLIGAMG